jgi:4'-phosphopantetheinyl transferase
MELLDLSPDQIDLWIVFFDGQYSSNLIDQYRRLLTEDEKSQELCFHFDRDRIRFILTRASIRTVLSRYSVIKPEQWRFGKNEYGKPKIVNTEDSVSRISFNISHSESQIILGVTYMQNLGIDTENVMTSKVSLDLADLVFSPSEVSALHGLPERMQNERFFEYWTLKESYIKAKGIGLSIPLNQLIFEFPDERMIKVYFHPKLNDSPAGWRFWQVRPATDYLMAVCVQRSRSSSQQLVMRRIVPLEIEQPYECTVLRQSN